MLFFPLVSWDNCKSNAKIDVLSRKQCLLWLLSINRTAGQSDTVVSPPAIQKWTCVVASEFLDRLSSWFCRSHSVGGDRRSRDRNRK